MIPAEFLQTLLARVDIVALIDRAVPLKKAGQNFVACCPFHKEKTPSFNVSPTKQYYHCFGCGAQGDAISFLKEYQGKSFPDAVEELAHSVGMEVPRDERAREQAQAAGGLFEVLLAAAQHYKTQLKQSPEAIAYFRERGVTGEIARDFHLGFAPEKWQGLAETFTDYNDAALDQAGLVIAGDGNKRYDRFRGRVMFPILNQQGRVIGFGGRVLGEGEPKYLNSPETPVFSKGRELYGLYQAQKAIRDNGRVLVVEGYMDVIALHQFGIGYAVATLGTATTEQHIERLFRLADEVVFSFDGDAAGQRAAWRALENAFPALQDGKAVKFLFLPKEHDPDSYIRALGTDAFAQRVREAEPLSRYWLRTLQSHHADDSPEARAALLAEAKTYLEKVPAPLMRDVLTREVASAARVDAAEFGKSLAPLTARAREHGDDAGARNAAATRPDFIPTAQKTPFSSEKNFEQRNHDDDHPHMHYDAHGRPHDTRRTDHSAPPHGSSAGSYSTQQTIRRSDSRRFGRAPLANPVRAAPASVFERLLRLGLDSPDLLVSLDEAEIMSDHPDALLLQSAVRLAKIAAHTPQSTAELIALAADPSLAESLQAKAAASMRSAVLRGKELEDEWRALIELMRSARPNVGVRPSAPPA